MFWLRRNRTYVQGRIELTDPKLLERIVFLGLTPDDLGVVASWAEVCKRALPEVSTAFYDAVNRSSARLVLEKHTTVERQRPVIERYLATLFDGRIDDAWVAFRVHVGKRHDDVNLDTMFYFGGYQLLREGFCGAVERAGASREDAARFREAFLRLLYLDAAVTLNALMDARLARVEALAAQQAASTNAFVQKLTEAVQRVADNDLTVRVAPSGQAGFDEIADLFNGALEGIDRSLRQVAEAAVQVATAASEVTAGSQSSAQNASSQAGKLEEISSSLREIAQSSRDASSSAIEAQKRTTGATTRTAEGMQAISRLAEAVTRIKQSSDETARILKTIDEIAFQTNLLALNAAVEAARAGDAGKGFAVVAEEVRNLAMRSADAARSTARLIEEGGKSAEGGVTAQQSVSTSLTSIDGGVRSVQGFMETITQASLSQARMVEQISAALEELVRSTQQNAATAEESASAAEELSGQASALQETVGRFQLTGEIQGVSADRSRGRRWPALKRAAGA